MSILALSFILFAIQSCDRKKYNGRIAVERHVWQLKRIDTLFRLGKCKPSATWYNRDTRLYYIDNDSQYPYPYAIGAYVANFDRK